MNTCVVYCGFFVANSILKKSFEDGIYITPLKLNCLTYFLYSNYLFKTGDVLFTELFMKTDEGLVLPSLDFKFGCFQNNVITKFAKDSKGKIFIINDDSFLECLSYIWSKYKYMSECEMLNCLNSTNAIKKREVYDVLSVEDILDDEINRNEELLERVKGSRIYRRSK